MIEEKISKETAKQMQPLVLAMIGDSVQTLFVREYIAKTYGATDDNILVTTHGATIRGIMSYIKGTSLRDFWRGGVQSNCGVTIIEITDESITIISENITF